uniref:Uncharacterized protein n=1 Tax=Anguilla anguilla TaxID=7936 RepID=A0A0E9XSM4_ANGAN
MGLKLTDNMALQTACFTAEFYNQNVCSGVGLPFIRPCL